MHCYEEPTRPSLVTIGMLVCLAAIAPATGFGTAATPDELRIRADCRVEGEAGGLAGADLEQFVEGCVADLRSVRLSNPDE